MKILLVTDSYPPEIRSASHLMLELAEELHARGHDISVVTSWPQYNLDQSKGQMTFSELTDESGVKVLRVKALPVHRVGYIIRGLSQFLLPILFLRKLKKNKLLNQDLVIVYSPPLPLAFVGYYFKKRGARFLLNVQDVFPDNAIDLGILKNSLLIRFYRWIEKQAYQAANFVLTHSDNNAVLLQSRFPQWKEKFKTLHNWISVEHFSAAEPKINFRDKYQLGDKFVIVFAGVLGPSQNLDFVVSVADWLKDTSDILFLMVGDGDAKQRLQENVKTLSLANVRFKPFISRDDYPDLLAVCDVGLVSLSPKNKTPVVPGKLLGYMVAGLPVLAFLNKESDAHQIIRAAGCGYSVESSDLAAAVEAVKKIYQERGEYLEQLGKRGCEYAKQHFSKQTIVNQLETLF